MLRSSCRASVLPLVAHDRFSPAVFLPCSVPVLASNLAAFWMIRCSEQEACQGCRCAGKPPVQECVLALGSAVSGLALAPSSPNLGRAPSRPIPSPGAGGRHNAERDIAPLSCYEHRCCRTARPESSQRNRLRSRLAMEWTKTLPIISNHPPDGGNGGAVTAAVMGGCAGCAGGLLKPFSERKIITRRRFAATSESTCREPTRDSIPSDGFPATANSIRV